MTHDKLAAEIYRIYNQQLQIEFFKHNEVGTLASQSATYPSFIKWEYLNDAEKQFWLSITPKIENLFTVWVDADFQ